VGLNDLWALVGERAGFTSSGRNLVIKKNIFENYLFETISLLSKFDGHKKF
jgi:hypothetical protein